MSEQRMYRGNRVDSKGWAYGYYAVIVVDSIVYCYIIPATATGTINQGTGQKAIEGMIEVIATSVRQSTGRKDKKGVEIYGGDKIRPWEEDDGILVVAWDDEHACWGTIDLEGKWYMQLGVLDLRKVFEVIGNTTDNISLLGDTTK